MLSICEAIMANKTTNINEQLTKLSQEIYACYSITSKNTQEIIEENDAENRRKKAKEDAAYVVLLLISDFYSELFGGLITAMANDTQKPENIKQYSKTVTAENIRAYFNKLSKLSKNQYNEVEKATIVEHFVNQVGQFLSLPETEPGINVQKSDTKPEYLFETEKNNYYNAEFKNTFSNIALVSLIAGSVILALGAAIIFPHLIIGILVIGAGLLIGGVPFITDTVLSREKPLETQKEDAIKGMKDSIRSTYQTFFSALKSNYQVDQSKQIEDRSEIPRPSSANS